MGVTVTNFTATPYDGGTLLEWAAGYGQSGSEAKGLQKFDETKGLWKFNESLNDESGNNNTLTASIPPVTYYPGYVEPGNTAIRQSVRISSGSATDFDFGTGDFTIEGWFKFGTQTEVLIQKRDVSIWTAGYRLNHWYIDGGTNDFIACELEDSSGSCATVFSDRGAVVPGSWYHIAVVVDRVVGTAQMYINGAANGSAVDISAWTGNIGDADENFVIDGYNTAYFDEICMTAKALTATEIQARAVRSIDTCKVTIQYSTEGFPHNFPNTPPYVTRDLQQPQGTRNLLWHPGTNGIEYYYSLFVYYFDSGFWHGAYNPLPTPTMPQSGSGALFTEGTLSYSKLETNTKISPLHEIVANIVIWLPEDFDDRKSMIEDVLNAVKPAHVKLNILYERYYIATTTSAQFNVGSFNSTVYNVVNGTIVNKVPTIDSSYSGQANILGEV